MTKYFILILSFLISFSGPLYSEQTEIIVGGDHNYPPYEFLKNDQPSGFNVELLKEASKLAGYDGVFRLTPWDKAVKDLETGKIDAITGMYYSEERALKFDFSLPYILVSSGVFVPENSPVKSLKDLEGLIIGVQNKDIMHDYALKNLKKSKIITENDPIDTLRLLEKNKVDAVLLSSKIQGAYYLFENKINNIRYFNTELNQLQYCFAVKKGNRKLIEKLNESLFILKTNGTYNRLYEKWFGKYEKRESIKNVLGYFLGITFVFLMLLGIAFIWTRTLGKRVKEKTRELSKEVKKRIKAEEELEIILESIGDGVITIDREKKILWLNSSAETMLSLKKEKVKGRLYFECIKIKDLFGHPIDLKVELITEQGQKRVLKEPFVLESETGEEFVVSGSGSPIKDKNKNITGGVFVIRDITREYELEKQLQHSRKMDALGRLAGGVAHDFNNMLAAIMGVAEVLEFKLEPEDENMELTGILKQACERASDLTSKLLAFSRKSPIEMKKESLHKIVENAASILQHTIDPKIKINLKLDAKNHFAMVNRARMENAVINIGLNARDAMGEGGTLEIETSNVFLDEAYCSLSGFEISPGDYICVSISDTGTGMSIALQKKIFEPFFTTKKKGTGLGLSSVYGVVQQHQGAVNVYSEENTGTVFHIYIPVDKSVDSPEKFDKDEKKHHKNSGVVLVIDDEEMLRTLAEKILIQNGYDVITAQNGRDGIEKFLKNKDYIDAVVLDMIMPEMDGGKCLEEIISIKKDAKVIIASGFYKDSTSSSLMHKGASCFIKKPYSSKELIENLEKVISG
jgi:two-component system sensor histidine kinase EvgS